MTIPLYQNQALLMTNLMRGIICLQIMQIMKHFGLQKRKGWLYFPLFDFLTNNSGNFCLEKSCAVSY